MPFNVELIQDYLLTQMTNPLRMTLSSQCTTKHSAEGHLASISGSSFHFGRQGVELGEFHNRVPEVPAQLCLRVCKEFLFASLGRSLYLNTVSVLSRPRQDSRAPGHSRREKRVVGMRKQVLFSGSSRDLRCCCNRNICT